MRSLYLARKYFSTVKRSKVFMDITIDNTLQGRLLFEVKIKKIADNLKLYDDLLPKTVENFKKICQGTHISPTTKQALSYKGKNFFRIIPSFMCQAGDVISNDGTSKSLRSFPFIFFILFLHSFQFLIQIEGESIFGPNFSAENYKVSLDKPGILGMINKPANLNDSTFFITFIDCSL
jgi:peptidylprolyl isomerase